MPGPPPGPGAGPQPDRLPAAIWVAAALDFLTAAVLFALALTLIRRFSEPYADATALGSQAGLGLAGAWLFLRLGRGLLDCSRLARVAQFLASGAASVGTVWAVMAVGLPLDLLGQELSGRAALGAVVAHLLGLLALLTPDAADRFRD